jgi:hypothetical protein
MLYMLGRETGLGMSALETLRPKGGLGGILEQ